jgi:hypothetical protein
MVDHYGTRDALDLNMKLEFQRNQERYQFMKWGMQAFDTFGVVPPGFGIVHQVNLEYLARGVHKTAERVYYPDSPGRHRQPHDDDQRHRRGRLGRRRHRGRGRHARPAGVLPDAGRGRTRADRPLREGVTATDLVLTVTELLRREKVVGKFVEFFGEGTESLSLPDRATIANMAPEYGATMGFFPVDTKTIAYFEGTGRTPRRSRPSSLLPRAADVRHPEGRRHRLQQRRAARPGTVSPQPGRPEAAAGPHRDRQREAAVPRRCSRAAGRERLQPGGRAPGPGFTTSDGCRSATATC